MNDPALEQIESKIAYLERANTELSDVVFRQQGEILALKAQVKALSERVQAVQPEERLRAPEDERPPHY
jgi:SlyX protein